MGAFIFNTVQTSYLNPLNLSPEDQGYFSVGQNDILQRVPSVFLLLGSIYTAIQLLAVLLISSPSEEDMAGNIPLVSQNQSEDPEEGDEDCSHPPFMPHRSYQSLTPPRILSTVWMECPHSFNALIFCWIFHNTRDSMHYHFAIRVKWQKKILKGTLAERRTYVYDSRRLSPQA